MEINFSVYSGQDCMIVAEKLRSIYPHFDIVMLCENTITTREYRPKRIRVWHNQGVVVDVTIG